MESVTALEELYYVSEMDKVRFIGWTTALARYDFAVVCTGQFFGKVLVVSLTGGQSALLDQQDVLNGEVLIRTFAIEREDVAVIGEALAAFIPCSPNDEYAE
ncbi:SAV0927 family protein [uncultured Exiguobacterium sp.]|uniref:SAV0927 family protein n=1 Tax=uncultured Exiguobacterium sp. TaxID=202669 RepID=UPI003748EA15